MSSSLRSPTGVLPSSTVDIHVVPSASLTFSLLVDYSSELALRWLSDARTSSTPWWISRALVSLLLRTTSETEARNAYETLLGYMNRPQAAYLQCLGFSPTTTTRPSERFPRMFAGVVYDLLNVASCGGALSPEDAALSYYDTAGPGTLDSDEYFDDIPDRRVPYAYSHQSTAELRTKNLAYALQLFAKAFSNAYACEQFNALANRSISRFLAPLLQNLPRHIRVSDGALIRAVYAFYNAFLDNCQPDQLEYVVSKVVDTATHLAEYDVLSLSTFLGSFSNAQLRFNAARMCLVRNFGVNDDAAIPLTIRTLRLYLSITPFCRPTNSRHSRRCWPLC